jgi:hypothetical protein
VGVSRKLSEVSVSQPHIFKILGEEALLSIFQVQVDGGTTISGNGLKGEASRPKIR